jgi:hypothetical protein
MSSSITIPRCRKKLTDLERGQAASGSSSSGFSPSTPSRFASSYDSSAGSPPKSEGEVSLPAAARPARRLSLLSKSQLKAEIGKVYSN